MPNVYVVNACVPRGGAYMAYQVGRVIHRHFGYELVNVEASTLDQRIFTYDIPMRSIPLAQMERAITDDDILVANPSLSSHLFGLRLKGRKICYVQDFRTFSYLDCLFDLYVSVSSVVRDFLAATYGLRTEVIPAYIELGEMPPATPWEARPPRSVLVHCKAQIPEYQKVLAWLQQQLPQVDFSHVLQGYRLQHREFLAMLGSARYLLNLSIAEGFGLVPLEAMAMGTAVMGLDGLAGRDYMRQRENAMTVSFKDLRELPPLITALMDDDALAMRLARSGQADAQGYGYGAFERAWVNALTAFLR